MNASAQGTEDRGQGQTRLVMHVVVIGCLALMLALSAHGLVRAMVNRVPLRLILGQRWWLVTTALVLATGLAICALARELSKLRDGRPAGAPFAFVRKLVCVAVLGWLFFLWRVQPFQRIYFDIALGLTAGAFAALFAAESWIARWPRKARRAVDILAFNLCLTAVLGELTLRTLAEWKPSAVFARVASAPTQILERNRCRPGQIRFGFPCNSGGHYDGEFHRRSPGERLVIAIGDSFSIGVVPHPFHFTKICERELGVPVYNMGVAGTNPPEYLDMLMKEALPLDPDLVVIDIFVGNDLIFPTLPHAPTDAELRSWFDSANVLLCVVPGRLVRLAREQRSRTKDQGVVGTVQGERTSAEVVGEADLAARFPWVADPTLEVPTLSEVTYMATESARVLEVCAESPTSFRNFFETFSDIHTAAGGIPLVVMLIPDEYQVEDSVWQAVLAQLPEGHYERDRAQRILLPWFQSQGIPCLDLLPLLRATPPLADGKRHLYHLCDTHFNARGNRVAGDALTEFLRPLLSSIKTR